MAASVIGAGVLIAVIIFAIYSKSRGEPLPPRATTPADLASRRWDPGGGTQPAPVPWEREGLRQPELRMPLGVPFGSHC